VDVSVDMPDVGERVRVRFQAGGEKVELDKSELRSAKKQSEQLERDRFAAIANAPPGSPPPPPDTPVAPNTQSTPSEMSAIKEARAAGDLAEVNRLKAEFAARAPKRDL
jgi:hypothetical protein